MGNYRCELEYKKIQSEFEVNLKKSLQITLDEFLIITDQGYCDFKNEIINDLVEEGFERTFYNINSSIPALHYVLMQRRLGKEPDFLSWATEVESFDIGFDRFNLVPKTYN